MIARKHGRCGYCSRSWRKGDEIKQKGGLFAHAACMDHYKAAMRRSSVTQVTSVAGNETP